MLLTRLKLQEVDTQLVETLDILCTVYSCPCERALFSTMALPCCPASGDRITLTAQFCFSQGRRNCRSNPGVSVQPLCFVTLYEPSVGIRYSALQSSIL